MNSYLFHDSFQFADDRSVLLLLFVAWGRSSCCRRRRRRWRIRYHFVSFSSNTHWIFKFAVTVVALVLLRSLSQSMISAICWRSDQYIIFISNCIFILLFNFYFSYVLVLLLILLAFFLLLKNNWNCMKQKWKLYLSTTSNNNYEMFVHFYFLGLLCCHSSPLFSNLPAIQIVCNLNGTQFWTVVLVDVFSTFYHYFFKIFCLYLFTTSLDFIFFVPLFGPLLLFYSSLALQAPLCLAQL